MSEINKIYAYKHDGTFHRMWDKVKLLKETKDYYICANYKKSKVYEKNNIFWRTHENAILYYSKNHWFNILIMFKKDKIVYYCNLATPAILEQDSIKYIDYELDVKYFVETRDMVLLDQNEYDYYKVKYDYPKWILSKIEKEKNILFEWIKNETGPFSEEFRKKWYIFEEGKWKN